MWAAAERGHARDRLHPGPRPPLPLHGAAAPGLEPVAPPYHPHTVKFLAAPVSPYRWYANSSRSGSSDPSSFRLRTHGAPTPFCEHPGHAGKGHEFVTGFSIKPSTEASELSSPPCSRQRLPQDTSLAPLPGPPHSRTATPASRCRRSPPGSPAADTRQRPALPPSPTTGWIIPHHHDHPPEGLKTSYWPEAGSEARPRRCSPRSAPGRWRPWPGLARLRRRERGSPRRG